MSIRETDIKQAYFWVPFGIFESISALTGNLMPISTYLFNLDNSFMALLGIVVVFAEMVSFIFMIVGLYSLIKGTDG
mgnify:CR=1 FL=1